MFIRFAAVLRLGLCSVAFTGLNFAASFSFQTFSVPGAVSTTLTAINNSGSLAGTYLGSNGQTYAFVDNNGTISTLAGVTKVGGINDKGEVAGTETANGQTTGFVWNGGKVSYSVADQSGNLALTGINNAGDIVSQLQPSGASNPSRIILRAHGGQMLRPSIPGSVTQVSGGGINNNNQFVGSFQDSAGSHGFLATISGQAITATPFDVPSATAGNGLGTHASDINDNGSITGYIDNGTGTQDGFLYANGAYSPLDVPGALNTEAFGINNSGEIVGIYDLPMSPTAWYSFLATPGGLNIVPEPSFCVLGFGALLVFLGTKRSILVSSKQKAKCSTPKDSSLAYDSESQT